MTLQKELRVSFGGLFSKICRVLSHDAVPKNLGWGLFFLVGWVTYLSVKLWSGLWIERLYSSGQWELLSRLAWSTSEQTIEFYRGRIHETFVGPFLQTLSFALLIGFVLRFCQNVSFRIFTLVIFLFLLGTKWEALSFPLYGDAIGGPFAEGFWLYQNGFDYIGLFRQPSYNDGGARVYFFSLYPGFLALTMRLIPKLESFLFFHHLLVFGLTAGIAGMIRAIGLKVFDRRVALLLAVAFVAMPLIQSQSEAVNMEVPVAFFMTLAAWGLCEKRWGLAAISAAVSAAVKGTGIVACAGVALFLWCEAARAKTAGERWRMFGLSFLPIMLGALVSGSKFLFPDTHVQAGIVGWEAGWPSLQREFIFYIFLMAVVVWFGHKFWLFFRGHRDPNTWLQVVMAVFAAGWFILFLNFSAVSPRYRVALYPFLILTVAFGFVKVFPWPRFQMWLTAGIVLLASWSSYGLFYPVLTQNDHVLLERSLEYRNDLFLNRELARRLVERYSDKLLVAPFILAQSLAIPELGYVPADRRLEVMIYGFGLQYGGILNYPGLYHLDPERVTFIGVEVAPIHPDFSYPVHARDRVLEVVSVGNKNATIFTGGNAVEILWRIGQMRRLSK